MTTLAELLDGVYAITDRPDLATQTKQAIKNATRKEHAVVDYSKDLAVQRVTLAASEVFRYSIAAGTVLFRKIGSIKEAVVTVPVLDTYEGYSGTILFEEVSAKSVFDGYHAEKINYWHHTGAGLSLVAARAVAEVDVLYYARVDVTDSGYASWIADDFPYVIQDAAAAEIFRLLGRTAEQKAFLAQAASNRMDVIASNVTAIG